ncbi:hypothetical protein HDU78_006746 [Chytriomyces hyalinus]|nr:hypothetical protein HDU78_006746 [Chytriomyces hyalinus]
MSTKKQPKKEPTHGLRKPALKADRITFYSHPQAPLCLTHDVPSNSLVVTAFNSSSTSTSPAMNQATILNESSSAIHSLFSHTKVSPNRLVYITVGLMFEPASPKPFGGPKIRPGYTEYNGTTVASLVQYIVSASFKWYWACRGRDAIDFLTRNVNKARSLHYDGDADTLNELMLKGMKKAGHIEWNKPARIPDALQHRPEVEPDLDRYSVEFTPRMKGSGLQQNYILSMVGEVENHAGENFCLSKK